MVQWLLFKRRNFVQLRWLCFADITNSVRRNCCESVSTLAIKNIVACKKWKQKKSFGKENSFVSISCQGFFRETAFLVLVQRVTRRTIKTPFPEHDQEMIRCCKYFK
eukprot:Pompholyxophrys_punicea_v1_NODE_470_length_1882_cov_22.671593.p2 type:complete len:107 gc:universal NODE_470_length_1882_cov_22.671593:428-748(+)